MRHVCEGPVQEDGLKHERHKRQELRDTPGCISFQRNMITSSGKSDAYSDQVPSAEEPVDLRGFCENRKRKKSSRCQHVTHILMPGFNHTRTRTHTHFHFSSTHMTASNRITK